MDHLYWREEETKSVGHSHAIPEALRDPGGARSVLLFRFRDPEMHNAIDLVSPSPLVSNGIDLREDGDVNGTFS